MTPESLLPFIPQRHSVRKYANRAIPAEVVQALQHEIGSCNTEGHLHIQLVTGEPKAFSGLLSYGKFSGVANYFVMAGPRGEGLDERVGYYGERLVLLAQSLGLNTCWVGMTFRKVPSAFTLAEGEKLVCVIALGYGLTQGQPHRVRTLDQVSAPAEGTPEWFRRGVEAALLAPTAVNQQKFRFTFLPAAAPRSLPRVKAERLFSMVGYTRIDLGIAKLHFELAAGSEHFVWGD